MRLITALLLPFLAPARAAAFTVAPPKMSLGGPVAREGGGALGDRRAFLGTCTNAAAAASLATLTAPSAPAIADEDDGRPSDDWSDYKYIVTDGKFGIPLEREKGFQKLKYPGSKAGTSEFLVVSTSHGRSGSGTKKASKTEGGGWEKIVYAGNDDRSVEMFIRDVTDDNENNPGKIDIKDGKGACAVVAYKKGFITPGKVEEDRLKKKEIGIKNRGKSPWLVAAVSDNGGELDAGIKDPDKSKADAVFGAGRDDPCFIYLTTDKKFKDKIGKCRGAIGSVELK